MGDSRSEATAMHAIITDHRAEIAALCERLGVRRLDVFGSETTARGRSTQRKGRASVRWCSGGGRWGLGAEVEVGDPAAGDGQLGDRGEPVVEELVAAGPDHGDTATGTSTPPTGRRWT